jgi:hypothetical protein
MEISIILKIIDANLGEEYLLNKKPFFRISLTKTNNKTAKFRSILVPYNKKYIAKGSLLW